MVAKMNTKRLLVSFCTIAIAMFLVATVSALSGPSMVEITPTTSGSAPITDTAIIEVDGINVLDDPSVVAGETVTVKVQFTALVDASDVRVEVEIEGEKIDVQAMSKSFDVEANHTYKKTLSLKVPFELKDEVSDDLTLDVEISGEGEDNDYKTEFNGIALRVQRPSYNPVVKSVSTSQSVNAGETFPVDLVLKNMGYNDLDDLYVTVSIAELGVQKTSYFGDLVPLEYCDDDCDSEDTVSGRIYLDIPYEAESGIYTLEVEVTNDDVTSTVAKQIVIENDLSQSIIVVSSSQSVAVGENAEYTLLLVNPTNSLRVYKVIPESNSEVSSNAESAVVAVPAGSSKTVTVIASAASEGVYSFDVSVLSGDKLVDTVTLNLSVEKNAVANPIVVLTVVLAIIFLVLLVVLIVLIGRKPKKAEEFGESYY